MPLLDYPVEMFIDGTFSSMLLPAAHQARWKPRKLVVGSARPRHPDSFHVYLKRKKNSAEAQRNVERSCQALDAHLFVFEAIHDEQTIVEVIPLVLLRV